MIAELILLAG